MSMFCNQCQEAARNQGCTIRGVCGKDAEVSNLQDALIMALQSLGAWATLGRAEGVTSADADRLTADALFTTITNVSFDPERIVAQTGEALRLRDDLAGRVRDAYRRQSRDLAAEATPIMDWAPADLGGLSLTAEAVAAHLAAEEEDDDIRSLRELLLYGLKGMAAYLDHAEVLGHYGEEISAFLQEGLAATADPGLGADDLIGLVMRCGAMGVQTMALLDKANTSAYGHPEPTQVSLGVREGPAILISGHDLLDLEELLQQTEGRGVNVYTHGEMLPANAYPQLKKYPHLAGNYGGSWWRQDTEFESFGGAILMTTNCLVPPRESYLDRLFTTGHAAWPGVPHIGERPEGGQKDFAPVIERALSAESPVELESGTLSIGFAHQTVLSVADKVLEAVQAGAIKRFVVMAGCDGRQKGRQYFTDVAEALPGDAVILTAGCAKYRYNKLDLGDIDGIPRVLDAGQCNDSYSLVVVAQALAEALGVEDINDLPISYDIAWYEQKAVIVLLALLSLGVKHIRLGPTLPAFVSPGVLKVLVEQFDVMPTGVAKEDVAAMVAGA